MQQLITLHIVTGILKCCCAFGKQFGTPQNVKIGVTTWPSDQVLGAKGMNIWTLEKLECECLSLLTHNDQRWKKHKCQSTDKWENQMWYFCTMVYCSLSRRNKVLIPVTTQMNFENICQVNNVNHQRTYMCDSIYMKCQETERHIGGCLEQGQVGGVGFTATK